MSTQGQVLKYTRGGRRRKDVPDLNIPPVVENTEQAGEPSISVAQSAQSEAPVISIPSGGHNQLERSTPPAPIDVEDLDDDVIISSPRAFEEAKKKSRRSQRTLVVDVESEEAVMRHVVSQTNKRRRGLSQPIINCDFYVNLEGSSGSMLKPFVFCSAIADWEITVCCTATTTTASASTKGTSLYLSYLYGSIS